MATNSEDDSESVNDPTHVLEHYTTPNWSVVSTPRPSQFELPSGRQVMKKLPIDEQSLSMNRFLLMRSSMQQRHHSANQFLTQPWEKPSFISSTFDRIFKPVIMPVSMPVVSHVSEDISSSSTPNRPRVPYAASILSRQSHVEDEDILRRRALIRWLVIIESDISTTAVGLKAEAEILEGVAEYNIGTVLSDVFSRKSTATLIKRSGDLIRYSNWCLARGINTPWRLKEDIIYNYMQHLKSNSSPSAATSFLSALRFAQHTVGLSSVSTVLTSRVCGAANELLKRRKTVKQAKPLTATQVYKLEKVALSHPDDKIQYIAGYLCFCLFACARFKDAMYAESWLLDMPTDSFGYIEARTKRHKTANISKLALMLPLVAFSCGLQDKSWGDKWFQLRDELEKQLDDGFSVPYVLPAVLRNNTWASRPMTTSEGSIFLREILRNEGEKVEGLSTHSLKATILSWASKAQMNIEDRRLLGHHVDRNQVSPLTYSRDALSGPLERLWLVLQKVKTGQFLPDESRASRAIRFISSISASSTSIDESRRGPDTEAEASSTVECTEITVPPVPDNLSNLIDNHDLEDCSSESDKDNSASSVSDISQGNDYECEDAMINTLRVVADDPVADSSIFIHKESGLGHVLRDEEGLRFLCGKTRTQSYRVATVYTPSVSMCLKCRPIDAEVSHNRTV